MILETSVLPMHGRDSLSTRSFIHDQLKADSFRPFNCR